MNLKSYRFLQIILGPVIDLYLIYRKKIGKEDSKRFNERLGKALIARPQGSLIWVHAASIGEAVSVLTLLELIEQKYPRINILITTGTVTSARLLEKRLPKNTIHQFVPIDMLHAVKRFIAHWRPDLAIWVESELWPNLVYETNQTGCPMIIINARMSGETALKWQKHKDLAEKIFGSFSLCLAQNETEAEKFSRSGIKNTIAAGNLKYEAPALPADPEILAKMVSMIGSRPIWLASATSKGEEEIAAYVHEKLAKKFTGLLTVIVPRHPDRAVEITKMLQSKNFIVAQRSKKEKIKSDTEIYVADTIGELGLFYRLSSIVFIGGSLVDHGGQNPLEPARLNCAVISGNNVFNFSEIYDEMIKYNALVMVTNKEELCNVVDDLLSNNNKQNKLADSAMHFVTSKSGILNKYLEYLDPYLKPLGKVSG